jgi:hypothetical protein
MRDCRGLPHRVLEVAAFAQQVVDQRLGMDLLLDIERRCMDNQIRPVLLILAAPNKLRI